MQKMGEHEYVFMSYDTLQQLRRSNRAESAQEVFKQSGPQPKFAHYEGKRVITTPRHCRRLPEGEILTHVPNDVKKLILRSIWSPHWPVPHVLSSDFPERPPLPATYPK